jgi:hypothetical protein
MTEDDTQARATIQSQIGKNYNSFPQRKAWDAFVTNMWTTYRQSAAQALPSTLEGSP